MSKLLLISNLLLGEKTVRACALNSDSFLADSPADSERNSGETQWACLRHAHALARSEPLSSVLVRGRGLEPPHLTAHPPQGCLSTSFNTRALKQYEYSLFATFFQQKTLRRRVFILLIFLRFFLLLLFLLQRV